MDMDECTSGWIEYLGLAQDANQLSIINPKTFELIYIHLVFMFYFS